MKQLVFKLGLLAMAIVGACFSTTALAQAPNTSPKLYDCKARNPNAAKPPPQPELPPGVAATMAEARAAEEFSAPCPSGQVPYPAATTPSPKATIPQGSEDEGTADAVASAAATGSSRVRARVRWQPQAKARARASGGGAAARTQASPPYWYSWAHGVQSVATSKGVNGLWVSQTNEQPYVDNTYGGVPHSLGQLWAINEPGPGCFSTAETGWSESLVQFEDVQPHLFIAAFDCGHWIGYAGGTAPWVQSSAYVFPNQALTHNDTFHVYGARMDGNNWWFYYDGQWVGYIPHSAWVYSFPSVLSKIDAGGEVATLEYSTCTDMGYAALFGSNPGAAMFGQVWYEYNYNTQSSNANLSSTVSDVNNYSTGNWSNPVFKTGKAFRYGGPGWC